MYAIIYEYIIHFHDIIICLVALIKAANQAQNSVEWVTGLVNPLEACHRNINHLFTSGELRPGEICHLLLIVSID